MGGFRERRSLICATTVCTVCEHAQPKRAKNSSHTTSAPAHEDSPHQRIVRWLSAYFLVRNSRSRRQSNIKPPSCFVPIRATPLRSFARSTRALHTNHDALVFPDGELVLLTRLCEGQNATVLTLPTQPKSAAEAEAQQRVAYVG